MQIKLTAYGLAETARAFQVAPQMARAELLVAATEATQLLEADVVGRYPKASGLTRGSITSDAFSTPAGVLGVVGSAAPVALFLELGTKPHTAPIEPLLQWVHEVLGKTGPDGMRAARGIQRKIAAKGTPARKLFEAALVRNGPAIQRMFEAAAGRIAARLGTEGGAA